MFIGCFGKLLNQGDAEDLHFRCLSYNLNLEVQEMITIFNSGSSGIVEEEIAIVQRTQTVS